MGAVPLPPTAPAILFLFEGSREAFNAGGRNERPPSPPAVPGLGLGDVRREIRKPHPHPHPPSPQWGRSEAIMTCLPHPQTREALQSVGAEFHRLAGDQVAASDLPRYPGFDAGFRDRPLGVCLVPTPTPPERLSLRSQRQGRPFSGIEPSEPSLNLPSPQSGSEKVRLG
ncbi:hypothetical protein chiPu_0025634 [Chiloscyllium punctatum]|uniref:Uncharacterized protein n=1 Tax=Chiloscyllium punctatum TaxID=137246 RepID=A0A401TH62_CHIPU|nr:hypothetical protein [Chiloscyllium punctatum]